LIALLLTFVLFGAPAAGFWLLVGGLDPIGRLVVASLASMVVVSLVAVVMLVFGLWYPMGGFAAVLVISAGFGLAGRRWHGPLRRTPQQQVPDEGDEWIFES
jgi:uncharacterized membrane protein YphA (DoxX/SURF4 family)